MLASTTNPSCRWKWPDQDAEWLSLAAKIGNGNWIIPVDYRDRSLDDLGLSARARDDLMAGFARNLCLVLVGVMQTRWTFSRSSFSKF